MSSLYLSRALQVLLQPLQGNYSTGSLTVTATGSTAINLPANSLGIPILSGSSSGEHLVKVERNPATADGSWPITTSGVVAATSVQGGLHTNLPSGTKVRWVRPPAGIGELATAGTFSGGTSLTTFGALKQVKLYKELGGQAGAKDFFSAQVGRYPAVVISWGGTTPADGSSAVSIGGTTRRLGAGKSLYTHKFSFFLISSRADGDEQRRLEMDQLRDDILEQIADRVAFRDMPLDSSKGISLIGALPGIVAPTSYVDEIQLACTFVLQRNDERVYNDWKTTRLRQSRTATTDAGPNEVDVTDPMP
jgi:hypothetical protein